MQKDGITPDEGVHKKMKYDNEFQKPIAIINTRVLVFKQMQTKNVILLMEDLNIFLNLKMTSNQD